MDLFNLATAAGEQNSTKKPLENTRTPEVIKADEEPKDAEQENKNCPLGQHEEKGFKDIK